MDIFSPTVRVFTPPCDRNNKGIRGPNGLIRVKIHLNKKSIVSKGLYSKYLFRCLIFYKLLLWRKRYQSYRLLLDLSVFGPSDITVRVNTK